MADYSTGRDLHIDVPLSNAVVGRRPDGFIADQLLPFIPVEKQSNVYFKTDHLINRRYDAGLTDRAPDGLFRKVHFRVSSDTYYAREYVLGSDWNAEDEANADVQLRYADQHASLVTDRMLIDFEVRVAGLANVSTNVATTFNVATPWSNVTGSRPLDDLSDMAERFRLATGVKPNVLLYPEEVGVYLRRNDQIRDILFGDRGGLATDQQVAALVNIPKVLVPSLLVNTAPIGETLAAAGLLTGSVSLTAAWAKKVWMFNINLMQGFQVDTWGQAFRWTNPMFGVPWAIQRFPFDARRKKQEIAASYYQAEKIISSDLATVIASVA